MVKKMIRSKWNEWVAGFSLVEVLIVVAVVTIISLSAIGSYTSSLKSTRDSRRKADLNTISKALESYYNDNGVFPASITAADLCATTVNCYLRTIPSDPKNYIYLYVRGNISGTNQSFQLYSALENNIDEGAGNDDTGTGTGNYGGNCGVAGAGCKYGISSTNTTP